MIRLILVTILTVSAFLSPGISSEAVSLPERIYHDSRLGEYADTIVPLTTASDSDIYRAIEIRGRFSGKTTDSSALGVAWAINAAGDYSFATISPASTNRFDDLYSPPRLLLTVGRTENGTVTDIIQPIEISKSIDPNGGDNSIAIEISEKEIRISIGSRQLHRLATIASSPHDLSGATGMIVRGNASISLIVTESTPDPVLNVSSPWSPEAIDSYFQTNYTAESPEGIWTYLDRNNNPDYARPGGEYQLAIVRSPDQPGFDIIYLSGAVIGSDRWRPGMKKGHLSPTTFSGHYNLTWFDSTMQRIDSECSASLEASSTILRLDFPLLKSSIRFSLLPQDR